MQLAAPDNTTRKAPGRTDWILLIFLFLFTNQATLSYKLLGLLFIYALRPNLNFGIAKGRIPKFYVYIILLSVLNLVLHIRDFSKEYLAAFSVSCSFWLFALLAYHQLKISLERYGPEGINSTMKVFTVANLGFGLAQLISIMQITGKLNPYTGLDFPYGMSTGDNIYGFFMQNSYYNMMVSSLLGVYFIYKRQLLYAVVSCLSLILVFGNVGTMIFIAVISIVFVIGILYDLIKTDSGGRAQAIMRQIRPGGNYRVYIPLLLICVVVLYSGLSPENFKYVSDKIQEKVLNIEANQKNNLRTLTELKHVDETAHNPFRNIHSTGDVQIQRELTLEDVKKSGGMSEAQRIDANMALTMSYIYQFKGKTLSMLETANYLRSSMFNALLGAGPVRFSSLTAQKMAGYDSSRIFLQILPHYISPLYQENHLLLIKGRRESESKYFSNANWPDSFYNQLLGEYGLAGLVIFLVFYIWYFVKKIRYWTYGFALFALIIPFFHITYMFEPLCVMVFFELLMEADIMEQQNKELVNG